MTDVALTAAAPSVSRRRAPWPRAAVGGALAAATALGAGELVAGLLPGAPSLLLAVGQTVVDLQPPGAKDFVVALFGTNDKVALEVFIVAVSLVIGAGLGVLALRRQTLASAGFGFFALVGFLAAVRDTQVMPALAIIVAAVAGGAAVFALSWFVPRDASGEGHADADAADAGAADARGAAREAGATMPDWSRRAFVLRAGAVAAGSAVAAVGGRQLLEIQRAGPAMVDATVPPASETAALPAGAELAVGGITPLVVPNGDFYRIDTALILPRVNLAEWRLRVHGLVEREIVLTFEELVRLPLFEQYVTIACVSNEVGGDLVGNAKWTGVRLREVLAMAGVRPEASQLVGRSVDGWTAGMPMAWVMDESREPMIAVLMNDAALPLAHGFPARLIVPGLYGYVSATKWLSELELTTLDGFDGYWVPKGWAKDGPILTQSRIDVPSNGATLSTGRAVAAGVAWAPDRGVSKVEVRVDEGDWREAALSAPISDTTWVQWRFEWDAEPGTQTLTVRATDGTGEVQTDRRTRPAPDGARGHHVIGVRVA